MEKKHRIPEIAEPVHPLTYAIRNFVERAIIYDRWCRDPNVGPEPKTDYEVSLAKLEVELDALEQRLDAAREHASILDARTIGLIRLGGGNT